VDPDSLNPDPDPVFQVIYESGSRILTKNWKKYSWEKIYLFDQKLQFTYPEASLKDIEDTGEAFSPQKRTFTLQK
jgi:hypothetical protein